MPTLAASAVRKQIAAGAPDPVYLITGEDELEKSALAAEFADLVEEGLHAFNVERLHAGEWTTGDRLVDGVDSVIAAARTLPMMAPRRVVTVLQAEAVLAPRRESDGAARAHEALEALLTNPELQTTLVLVTATLDKRTRMYRLLQKQATIVECGAVEDRADAERWVRTRVAAGGVEIEPHAARLLVERAGLDVRRLRAEVDRLLLYTLGQPRIGVDDARAIAGPAALLDDWALTNAIEAAAPAEALRQLALMLDAGAPPEKILGQLGWLVRTKFPQIAPADVRQGIEALFRTDQDLKRSAGDARILLERLVVELCARKRARTALGGA
ncbi:MAG TPA: DNA polymerase III subunit delta [Vicinamibacterales bacterium]|nr:DNA polymerase III subunit delta [Vicinamibacterales bacterium]